MTQKMNAGVTGPSSSWKLHCWRMCSAEEAVIPARGKAIVKTDLSIAIPLGTYARVGELGHMPELVSWELKRRPPSPPCWCCSQQTTGSRPWYILSCCYGLAFAGCGDSCQCDIWKHLRSIPMSSSDSIVHALAKSC